MKKSVIVLWIVAALFLVVAVPLFSEDVAAGISGVALSAILAFIGWRKYDKQKNGAKTTESPVRSTRRRKPITTTAERAGGDNSRVVYYTMNGKCYHYNRSCIHADEILSCTENQVKNLDIRPCPKCCK